MERDTPVLSRYGWIMSELDREAERLRTESGTGQTPLSPAQTKAADAVREFASKMVTTDFPPDKLWTVKTVPEKSWKRIYRDERTVWETVESGWSVIDPLFERVKIGLFVSQDGRGFATRLETHDWGPDGNKSWEYRNTYRSETRWLSLIIPKSACPKGTIAAGQERGPDDPYFRHGKKSRIYVPLIDALGYYLVNGTAKRFHGPRP